MHKWLLPVICDVELVEVVVEVSRLLEVDETRNTFEVLEVKDLEAMSPFQQPSTPISPCAAS